MRISTKIKRILFAKVTYSLRIYIVVLVAKIDNG